MIFMLPGYIISCGLSKEENDDTTVFMDSLRVVVSTETDPFFNLAAEAWLYRSMDARQQMLLLWRNSPCVVIGRYQNPWRECRLQALERDGVELVRRQSGGGTVYHDLGNTNFTFFSNREHYSKERNTGIITDALAGLNIQAEASGRNDIVVSGRKISGSAFKLSGMKAFHHGTLLINADLRRLQEYLTPRSSRLDAKGIPSQASPVANLTEFVPGLNHETVCDAVISSFSAAYGAACRTETLDRKDLLGNSEITELVRELKSWEWVFGKTPEFTHRITEAGITLRVKRGIITDVEPSGTAPVLIGRTYSSSAVLDCRSAADRQLRRILEITASKI